MKLTQFVETTRDRYVERRDAYIALERGGRVEVAQAEPCDQFSQERVWHNAAISDIGQQPEWALVGMALLQRYRPEHSQYFLLEVVDMGVKTTKLGLNGQEEG